MDQHRNERRGERRVDVAQAAELLGISKDAVRMRIRRGTLRAEKIEGRMHVFVDTEDHADVHGVHTQAGVEASALVEELRDRVSYVQDQLEAERQAHSEARRLLAAALERIPAIEAPQERPGGPETAAEGSEPRPHAMDTQEHSTEVLKDWTGDVQDRPRPQEEARRPWWKFWQG